MEASQLVILASGVGSRFRGRATPERLVELAGISVLERAIAGAATAGFKSVVVVVRPRTSEVERHVLEVSRRRGIAVTVVHDDRYREGIGLSVLAARDCVGNAPFAAVMVDRVFSRTLLRRLKHASVRRDEVVLAVDARTRLPAGVERHDVMKVSVAHGDIQAIGRDLSSFDGYDVGAWVCGPGLFGAVETAVAAGDSSLAAAVQVLADAGAARALPIGDEDWWFAVTTPRDHRNATRQIVRATGKPIDGTIAARINGPLSRRMVTPALLALFSPITPNQVTITAFTVALAGASAFAAGAPVVAGLLVALAAVLDRSDGEVARLTDRCSSYGGFLDAVLDRASDGMVFTGASVYLATDARLGSLVSSAQVPLAIAVSGIALVGHLLVSYTTAKAAVDLGHRYHGTFLGGGKGRDRRLLLITLGALVAPIEPAAVLVSMAAVALLSAWIVVVRLRWSWWMCGAGSQYIGIRAVALDFDGTIADSMDFLTDLAVGLLVEELGFARRDAERRYVATAGSDFESQLYELAPGDTGLAGLAQRFEVEKTKWMRRCEVFTDVAPAVERLVAAGVPVLLCSSTAASLVREFCERYDLLNRFDSVDGWAPGHTKASQLEAALTAAGLAGHEVVFVGDARRDADVARVAGTRFVGLVRAGRPDAFAGSGDKVVRSLAKLATEVVRALRCPVTQDAPQERRRRDAA